MNTLLENKIVEEIKNPANTMIKANEKGDQIFAFYRANQVFMTVIDGWDSGRWSLSIGANKIVEINGSTKDFYQHPACGALGRIITACQARDDLDKARKCLSGIELAAYKILSNQR